MAKNNVSSLLTSVDELFTTQEERDIAKRETVMDIPLAEISDFPNHPFKVTVDEKLLEMADSVKRYGVLVPAIVRPKQNGGYEMIAGHRRKKASELAERPTLNCIVRDLTDDEAIIIMVDSNLQREVILPSEKAFAYKMKLDAMKRQGHRTDLTSTPMEPKLSTRSNEQLAAESPDSRAQIQRFIRLTHLIPELLDIVLASFYGLRRSEVLGLKWSAIDFQQNTITIQHTLTSCQIDGKLVEVAADTTKTKSSRRTLPLIPQFRDMLLQRWELQEEYKRVCGRCYNRKYLDYICVDEMGNIIKPDYLTDSFSKLLARHGLRHIRFHDLRHTCASLLLKNGVPMKQIQEWLGHSDFSTTANIYAHLDYNSKLNSAQAMMTGMSAALITVG